MGKAVKTRGAQTRNREEEEEDGTKTETERTHDSSDKHRRSRGDGHQDRCGHTWKGPAGLRLSGQV